MMQSRSIVRHTQFTRDVYDHGSSYRQQESRANMREDFYVANSGNSSGDHISPSSQEFSRYSTGFYTGSVVVDGPSYSERMDGPQPLSPPYDAVSYDPNVYNDALSQLFDKIRSNVDLSVDLLQGGQTAAMFRSIARASQYLLHKDPFLLDKAFNAYSRWKAGVDINAPLKIRRAVRDLGSKWLEFQYGWKPLASDLYGACVELDRAIPPLMKVRSRAQSRSRTNGVDSGSYSGQATLIVDKSTRCQFECTYQQGTSHAVLMSNFTSMNPISIAWELLPYSFVVDWFIDVGGFLRNYETNLLYDNLFKGGYRTETFLGQTAAEDYVSFSSSDRQIVPRLTAWAQVIGKRRAVLFYNPSPRIPQFKCDLGSGRLLNAAALLSQKLRR